MSGLLGLVAYGAQDVYLTQEPKIPYCGKNSRNFDLVTESLREIKQPLNFKKGKVENKMLNMQSLMTDLLDIKQRFEKNINKNEIIDINKIPYVT